MVWAFYVVWLRVFWLICGLRLWCVLGVDGFVLGRGDLVDLELLHGFLIWGGVCGFGSLWRWHVIVVVWVFLDGLRVDCFWRGVFGWGCSVCSVGWFWVGWLYCLRVGSLGLV